MSSLPLALPGLGTAMFGRRHPQPVHRGSTRREIKWSSIGKKAAHAIYYAAKRYDRRTKIEGRHGGTIGHAAMEVLRVLVFDFYSYGSGRCDPSYEAIARMANVARSTAAAALKRLRDLGIINWVRRCSDSYEDGIYVLSQETNAYALVPAPQWADAADLPARAPLPDRAIWSGPPAPPPTSRWEEFHAVKTAAYAREPIVPMLTQLATRLTGGRL